jgi:hypothetical protein
VAALGEVLEQLASAGFAAGLTVHLLEPAGVLSGWQGADAAVAATEVGTALAVAADLHEALTAAGTRLATHHELWTAVQARVEELRESQRTRFADGGAQLAALLGGTADDGATGAPPAAYALVDAVAGQDAAAAAEHAALLQALAEDAAGAVAVLTAATGPLGGVGRPDGGVSVTARLAVALPGWGAGALATLGQEAAADLTGPATDEALTAAVARWLPYAAVPGFADGLVGRLGPDGVRFLLSVLGERAGTGDAEPLAALLAGAFGSDPGDPGGPVAEVLTAVRLDPRDTDGAADAIAVAMGLVLAAPGAGGRGNGGLAAVWGRQLLDREAAQGARAGAGSTGGALLADPVNAALDALVRSGDREAAALLLADPGAWTTLLSRPWPGGTDGLAAVVGLAAAAPGAGRVARAALLALGRGLAPGSADLVLDDQGALARVRPEVTALVAGRPDVVVPVLDAAVTGAALDVGADAALRGLGYLVSDAAAAEEVDAAVSGALQGGAAGAFAGQVAGAHLAVLEYGQRLRYALDWSRAKSRAVDGQIVWTLGVTLPVALLPRGVGDVAGGVADLAAEAVGADGDVEIGPDRGAVRTGEDAAAFAAGTLGPAASPGARAGFDRVGELLGDLGGPRESLLDRLGDLDSPNRGHRPRRPH